MRLQRLAVFGILVLACNSGPRKGPEANGIYFWQVKSSTLEWGTCSDNTDFRTGAAPIAFSDNSYLVYKVDKDVKKAVAQSCSALDPKTCSDSSSGVVFDIAGTELTFTQESKDPIGDGGCSLQQDQTWTFEDKIQTFNLEIDNVLSLVDAPAVCENIETNLKANSPNMNGVTGCVVTFKLSGDLR